MKKTKLQKGITLIALIISIVVLLILAIVTIGAVQESGIIGHAQNVASDYTIAQEKEQIGLAVSEYQIQKTILGSAASFVDIITSELNGKADVAADNEDKSLSVTFTNTTGNVYTVKENGTIEGPLENTGGDSAGDEDSGETDKGDTPQDTVMPVATVGTKTTENSTINGEEYSSSNPVIPIGFMAINTETSAWDAESGPEVANGLVISDGTSEFVWIPVSNIEKFAVPQSEDSDDYRGILYAWDGDFTGSTELTWSSDSTSYREPANLSSSSYDNRTNMSSWTETLYQDSFNSMVASVSKYSGFYVGRYETSLNGSVAQSKSGETPMNKMNWYRMYEYSLTYSTSNSSLGVTSEMIWGCQWDAMLRFILTGSEASHVTATTNVSHDLSSVYSTGGTDYTGSVTYNDIASNIYDLEGNVSEYTQEANDINYRIYRGGNYFYNSNSPWRREMGDPANIGGRNFGSRLSLYVKL